MWAEVKILPVPSRSKVVQEQRSRQGREGDLTKRAEVRFRSGERKQGDAVRAPEGYGDRARVVLRRVEGRARDGGDLKGAVCCIGEVSMSTHR